MTPRPVTSHHPVFTPISRTSKTRMRTVYPGGLGHAVTRHGMAPTEGLHCIACIGDLWTALDRKAGGTLGGALGENTLAMQKSGRRIGWGFHPISITSPGEKCGERWAGGTWLGRWRRGLRTARHTRLPSVGDGDLGPGNGGAWLTRIYAMQVRLFGKT